MTKREKLRAELDGLRDRVARLEREVAELKAWYGGLVTQILVDGQGDTSVTAESAYLDEVGGEEYACGRCVGAPAGGGLFCGEGS